MNVLHCENVVKTFQRNGTEVRVLDGLNIALDEGECVLVRGRSGQGKSVLLSLVSGLDMPTSGRIVFNGTSLHSLSRHQLAVLRRRSIGIIFQNLNLIPSWTASENIEAALLGSPYTEKEKERKAADLLDLFGLAGRWDHLPTELSLGEQQRVAVARTLVREPQLILGDEPTGELDDETAHDILDVLFQYRREKNISLLITTHGHFPIHYADRAVTLGHGKLSEEFGAARSAQIARLN